MIKTCVDMIDIVSFVSYSRRYSGLGNCISIKCPTYLVRGLKRADRPTRSGHSVMTPCCPLGLKTVRQALDWFGCLSALVLEAKDFHDRIVLVPIPDSRSVATDLHPPSTLRLANAISRATKIATIVSDCLRWRLPQTPSHRGGTRDPEILARQLYLVADPPAGLIVLVDDVVTSGGHIAAAATKLASVGYTCRLAICLGRTELAPNPLTIKCARIVPPSIATNDAH